MAGERQSDTRKIDWAKLIEEALNSPGNIGNTYDRFYNYSFLNQVYLLSQGVREPIATAKRWQAIGRTVLRGARAKEIICPVIVQNKRGAGETESRLIGFKPVRCIFTFSETEGDELPPVKPPEWDEASPLEKLKIRRVPFTELNGNIQGASRGRDVSVNPVAKFPLKSLMHEVSHVVLRHTIPEAYEEYATHHGIKEFEAEASAHLVMNELQLMDNDQASVSRAYIQGCMQGERPPEKSIRRVFGAVDTIIKAGKIAVSEIIETADTQP